MLPDSVWFLYKDKFVVDISPIGKTVAGAIGRKTTTYRNIDINDTAVTAQIKKNKIKEEIIFAEGAREKEDEYWKETRETLEAPTSGEIEDARSQALITIVSACSIS